MTPLISVAAALNPSKDFDIEYVERLFAGVRKYTNDAALDFYLFSPEQPALPGVRWVKTSVDLPGWWIKTELWAMPGPLLYLDLDTEIVGSLAPLIRDVIMARGPLMLRDLSPGSERLECGVMGWPASTRIMAQLYRRFQEAKGGFERGGNAGQLAMRDNAGKLWLNDEDWMRAELEERCCEVGRLQDQVAGIYSYSLDIGRRKDRALPEDAMLVCFHGLPRPRDLRRSGDAPAWMAP